MKNKELKKFESVAFIMLEALAKAVEMKKLQLEEKKLNIDRELWIEQRSGQKVGSPFPSGEKYPKYKEGGIIYHGSDSNKSDEEMIRGAHCNIMNMLHSLHTKSSKDIHEEALENGLKTEKKSDEFSVPNRNINSLRDNENYFFVDSNKWTLYLGDNDKELFYFLNREERDIVVLKTPNEVEHVISKNLEIYFRWVVR